MQRRAALFVLAIFSVIGCGGKKPVEFVDTADVAGWAKKNACVAGAPSASDVLSGAQFSCVKTLGECGCRAVVSARSKSGGEHFDTVQIVVANCRREIGVPAAEDIMAHLPGILIWFDLDRPLHEKDDDAPTTAMSVTHHYLDRDHPDRDAVWTWSKDVFADGKPQRTETYKIVVSTPPTSGDHKMTWSETPTVSTAPPCTSHPAAEDMASIPAGPGFPLRLRCPRPPSDAPVPAFDIDRNIITVEQYRTCIDAHACTEEPDDFPLAAVVSHASAEAYCKWRHARLPTWNEWQRAIRGADAKRTPTGSAWDPVAGCRVPTMKNEVAGRVRCENTTVDGVTYYVLDRNNEWTSDDDCVDAKDPTQRQPIALNLIEVLDRGGPREAGFHAEFRCARPHGAN